MLKGFLAVGAAFAIGGAAMAQGLPDPLPPASSTGAVTLTSPCCVLIGDAQISTGNVQVEDQLLLDPDHYYQGISNVFVAPDPTVVAQGEVLGNLADYNFTVDSRLIYFFEISGASGHTFVPVDIGYQLYSSNDGSQVGIDVSFGSSLLYSDPVNGPGSRVVNTTLGLKTNTAYKMYIYAITRETGSAFVDPVLSLDPADAANYTLMFSPGVGNTLPVPEPDSRSLLAVGGALVFLGSRRRSQT